MSGSKRLILLTNDDGFAAPGLIAIRRELQEMGLVIVVAPAEERSATSHALTIHHPIRVKPVAPDTFAVTGTPADCVILALRKLLKRSPDLIVSGINNGANLGDDVMYSGTVAGAREGAISGIPSFAVSLVNRCEEDFAAAARVAGQIIRDLYPSRTRNGTFFNINVPDASALHYRLTRQGSKRAFSAVQEKEDPRGQAYFWIGQDQSEWLKGADTDYQAIHDGVVSVTPLQRDQTDHKALRFLTEDRETKPGEKPSRKAR